MLSEGMGDLFKRGGAKSREYGEAGNGRLYDPLTGMFLSPDNYVQSPGNSQNFNRYSYCLNNPLSYSDPSGMLIEPKPNPVDAGFPYNAEAAAWLANYYYEFNCSIGGGSVTNSGYVASYINNSNLAFYGYTSEVDYYGEILYRSKFTCKFVSFEEYYANQIVPDLARFAQAYIDRKVAEIQNTIKEINEAVNDAYNETLTAGPGGRSFISALAKIIPDRISLSFEAKVAVVLGIGQNIEINWITKGDDAKWLPYITNTLSKRYGIEADIGIALNCSWYIGPSNEMKKEFMYGPTWDVDGGYMAGGTLFLGLSDTGQVVWIGVGGGVGGTLGGSVGKGYTNHGLINYDPDL